MIRTSLPGSGMTCQKCVAKGTAALTALPGVEAVEVSLAEMRAAVTHDPFRADGEGLAAAVVAAGFGVAAQLLAEAPLPVAPAPPSGEQGSVRATLLLKGMHCANCARTIEKGVADLPGVVRATVNFAAEKLSLSFDPAVLDAAAVAAKVRALGYEARSAGAEERDESRRELGWLLFSALLTAPILPLMWFSPFGAATFYQVMVLATVVQFSAGLIFYRGAWISLRNRSTNMDVLVALGISAAYGYSLLTAFRLFGLSGQGFFETGAMLITFIRFGKWMDTFFAKTGVKVIIGKGGMSSKDYKATFVPHGALYLTTVGYGEIIDMSHNPAARLFTVGLLLLGMGVVAYTVPMLAAFFIEGQMLHIFARRRMDRLIDRMTGHYIVCGRDAATWYVAGELRDSGRQVVLIVPSEQAAGEAFERLGDVPRIVGDASEDDVLREAGVERAGGVVTCMESHKDNVLVALAARRLAPTARIVASTESPDTEAKLRTAGADAVVSPSRIGGARGAERGGSCPARGNRARHWTPGGVRLPGFASRSRTPKVPLAASTTGSTISTRAA